MGKTPARWRHGGLLLYRHGDTLRVCGSPKKQDEKRSFLAPPQKAALGLASRPHSPFRAPRETGAEKEKKQMNKQIKQTNQGQFNVAGAHRGGHDRHG